MISIFQYADVAHRAQVEALWCEAFGYDTAHNRPGLVIDRKVEIADGLFFVGVQDGAVVGTVMAGYDGHRGWLYSVAVDQAFRNRGIGTELVLHAERALEDLGCVKINLQIADGNEPVAAFYEALGFIVEKRISMGKRVPKNAPPG